MAVHSRVLVAGIGCIILGACASHYLASDPQAAPIPPISPASQTLAPPTSGPGTLPSPAPATMTADGYRLVWHDEFDKDGPLNPADWAYENGFVRNQEAQFYQPDNALCKGGFLIIEARKESKPNPRYNPPPGAPPGATTPTASATTPSPGIAIPGPTTTTSAPATAPPARRGRGRGATSNAWPNLPTIDITAASVNTRGKHEFTYGRFEIRARVDTRSGSWPAFWTLGTGAGGGGGWPGNGEIDIMEYYRNMVLANIAWQGPNGALWNSVRLQLNTLPPDFSQKFHTWRMDWDAASIQLFLDDRLINSQDLSKTINTAGRGAGTNPFIDKPVYLLLNQAIGGQNGGDYSQTQFPILFYIDYVRVYQKPAAATTTPQQNP